MRLGREKIPTIDVRSGQGLEWLLNGVLYEKKPPVTDDLAENMAFSSRPQYVRAHEMMVGPTRILTEEEVLMSAVRRITSENAISFNNDFIAMTVEPDALNEPTLDIRIYRYWDFVSTYKLTVLPEAYAQT